MSIVYSALLLFPASLSLSTFRLLLERHQQRVLYEYYAADDPERTTVEVKTNSMAYETQRFNAAFTRAPIIRILS